MTQSEFIKQYCVNSKTTEEKLNELGVFAMPCRCNYEDCKGWVMIRENDMKHHLELNFRT